MSPKSFVLGHRLLSAYHINAVFDKFNACQIKVKVSSIVVEEKEEIDEEVDTQAQRGKLIERRHMATAFNELIILHACCLLWEAEHSVTSAHSTVE